MYIYMKCSLEIKSLVPTPSWQWQLDFQRERKEELQVYLINITIYSVCVNKKTLHTIVKYGTTKYVVIGTRKWL